MLILTAAYIFGFYREYSKYLNLFKI